MDFREIYKNLCRCEEMFSVRELKLILPDGSDGSCCMVSLFCAHIVLDKSQ